MTQRILMALLIAGAVVVSSTGAVVAGSAEQSRGSAEVHPMAGKSAAKAPVLAPNDYLEFLESSEAIETGSLTAPGVRSTTIPGPSEPVVVPEGG